MIKKSVLILGSRSDIGLAIAHRFASEGHPLQLAIRNAEADEATKTDIEIRHGVKVTLHEFDVLATNTHQHFVDSLPEMPEIAICVVGLLGSQSLSEHDIHEAIKVIRSNFEGPSTILAILANRFEARGSGTIVGISSVAGERGRATNYVYGSSKAGFTAFLSGLRNRMTSKNVHVVTMVPGYVRTKMTRHLKLPQLFTSDPVDIANLVYAAVASRKDIVYSKWWFWITAIIRIIPERLFKRMSL